MAGWLRGGSTVWFSDSVLKLPDINKGAMICFHPHGLIPVGFMLNGALRATAQRPKVYLPSWAAFSDKVSGIQAPALFKVPLLRWILLAFGCCVPASKKGMNSLMERRVTFGMIPGGSEEVAWHTNGSETIYIRNRAGFIKFALRHGYTIVIAYTFGESDLYSAAAWLRPLNLFLVKKLGIVLPIFAGCWFCPLLPRRNVSLNTVYGTVLSLPKIEDPTPQQVQEWHARYVEELEELFEAHKGQFGYGDRKLKLR